MREVLAWMAENPGVTKALLAIVMYLLACWLKDKALKAAAAKKMIETLEQPQCKPAREAIARTDIGSLVDKFITNESAKTDPSDKKQPESKAKRILRGVNIAAGLWGLFKNIKK
jgi:hypothetical protein